METLHVLGQCTMLCRSDPVPRFMATLYFLKQMYLSHWTSKGKIKISKPSCSQKFIKVQVIEMQEHYASFTEERAHST